MGGHALVGVMCSLEIIFCTQYILFGQLQIPTLCRFLNTNLISGPEHVIIFRSKKSLPLHIMLIQKNFCGHFRDMFPSTSRQKRQLPAV